MRKTTGNVIDLHSALPDLTGTITIEGPGAKVLIVRRDAKDPAFRVFTVDSGATAAISGLTISGGNANEGGGISNAGSLTVSDSVLSNNHNGVIGGGIYNTGSLVVSDSTLSGNFAYSGGGGLYNTGSLTVSDSTLSGNTSAKGGGGIWNSGSLTISDSTLSGNNATDGFGGGINNELDGILTVIDSSLSGNGALFDGGIFDHSTAITTLTNDTIADNGSVYEVGGVGGTVDTDVLLHNTLIAGNLAGGNPSDVVASLDSASDYNLIGDGSGKLSTANHNLLGSPAKPLDSLLAPLGNYGGPTQTMALLPGSPAIDAGSSAYGGSTDQRGKSRIGTTDIGAFESPGFTIALSSGNNQCAPTYTAFAQPLVVSVTANNPIEPVASGRITFTAPASGACAGFIPNPATIAATGQASVTAIANATTGTYTVSASAPGVASPAKFSLSNTIGGPTSLVVTTLLDGNNPSDTTSLRQALAIANAFSSPQTITFDPSVLTKTTGNVIDLLSALPDLTGNVTIEGPGANVLTVQRDAKDAAFSVLTVDRGATAAISGLTIFGGSAAFGGGIDNTGSLTVRDSTLSGNSANTDGGGIYNAGSVTVSGSTLSSNSAYNGGGIYNAGSMTVSDSTLSGNAANGENADGGGIYNAGSMTVSNSALSGNAASFWASLGDVGGGIFNEGSLTVSDSTLSGNYSSINAGGIYNSGSLTVSDSTLSGNTAEFGVGGGIDNAGSMTVSNSTLSGNITTGAYGDYDAGGGIYNSGSLTVSDSTLYDNSIGWGDGGGINITGGSSVLLHNTLIAGNLAGGNPCDVSGSLETASDYNLIGDGSGGLSTANHNLLGSSGHPLNPLLAPLGNYGGSSQTMALLPGSPAIDAGSSAYGGSTDQRGKQRGGATDIGGFESQGFNIAVSSGNNQSANTNTAFANPLVVSVTANNSIEPVAGGVITFTVPASGASAILKGSQATIGSDGKASVTATAGIPGSDMQVSRRVSQENPVVFALNPCCGMGCRDLRAIRVSVRSAMRNLGVGTHVD
jgi:hypothetical protein